MPSGRIAMLLAGLATLGAVAGCKSPPEDEHAMPIAEPAAGLAVIRATGCGACHTIPGLSWPEGRVGPPLAGFARSTLIAGALPNRPDVLARYVRNAPSLIPGSTMPAIPMTEEDARNVAAYLYTLRGR